MPVKPRSKRQEQPVVEAPVLFVSLPLDRMADIASTVTVRLIMEGKKAEADDIWQVVRREDDISFPPPVFLSVLNGPSFKSLLDIRLRRAALSSVEETVFLRTLCRDISKLAGDALLEDLILRPDQIDTSEKRRIAKEFGQLYEELTAKERRDDKPALPAATPEEATIEQATAMEQALERVPAALRERAIRSWKLSEVNRMNDTENKLRGLGQSTE